MKFKKLRDHYKKMSN